MFSKNKKEIKNTKEVTKDFKRLVVISDLHCGNRIGLTPTDWQWDEKNEVRKPFAIIQKKMWNWYIEEMKKLQPIDILIINGDALDGKGERSGGTELLESDRHLQVDMAKECVQVAIAKEIIVMKGTAYHVGDDEDYEGVLADLLGTKHYHDHLDNLIINGLKFDVRHHVGGTQVPYARHTAINRDLVWNMLKSIEYNESPADVIIRSHVHFFAQSSSFGKYTFITPALQGPGSKYGATRCSGMVDIGFLSFDIKNKDEFGWTRHIMQQKFMRKDPLLL